MATGQEETSCVDTGLALGLSIGGPKGSEPSHHHTKKNPNPSEPSLTLSLKESTSMDASKLESETSKQNYKIGPTNMARVLSPPQSAVSYIQGMTKRERESDVLSNNSNSRVSEEEEEEEDGGARKKLRLTKEQSALLEDRFKEHTTLNPKQKLALAKQLNLRPRQVEVWFQNRRARTKLKQTEVDCELLKRCCETLAEENRRLQKELQELKTLKFIPSPLYMQFPALTLTLCPSCERIGGGGNTDSKECEGSKSSNGSVQFKSHFFNPFTHSTKC